MEKIRLFKPSVGGEELKNIRKVFKASWLGYGALVNTFEKKFAKFIGTKFAVAVNSGTAALHALFYVLAVNSVGKAITQYLGVDRAF